MQEAADSVDMWWDTACVLVVQSVDVPLPLRGSRSVAVGASNKQAVIIDSGYAGIAYKDLTAWAKPQRGRYK